MQVKMYKTIVIDPPWKKSTGGIGNATLQASTHYPVQTKEQIIDTIASWFSQYPVAPEAHMYMWSINSFTAGKDQGILEESLQKEKIVGKIQRQNFKSR